MDLFKGVLILRIFDKEIFFDIRKYVVIIVKKYIIFWKLLYNFI